MATWMNRRQCLGVLGSFAALPVVRLKADMTEAVVRLKPDTTGTDSQDKSATAKTAGKAMRGAFMILTTPFTADRAVDWADLIKEVEFVDRAGGHGIVWPQGSSSVASLTKEERLHGMQLLAQAGRGKRVAVVLGVQGKDIDEMLEYTRAANALSPDALIAMPPTTGQNQDDYRQYFRALGKATTLPVIVQTSGGARNLAPSTDLIVELAKEMPNFGYVKEESDPVVERMKALVKNRPPMKSVFGANFGLGWLYEMRLGLDGVITGSAMYADVLAKIWEFHLKGDTDRVRDAYSRFLLMRNLSDQIPGADLYVMKKRGIFKTTMTRNRTQYEFSPDEIAEIDYRFAGLSPYLMR